MGSVATELYISKMKRDEVMSLKRFDSDLGGRARFSAHSVFDCQTSIQWPRGNGLR
ncbi:MAG: hypothetical protein IIA75_04220 [Proteobacteria bacterium]|nr:hypothetical protein [Pseudomonadota bacterium]